MRMRDLQAYYRRMEKLVVEVPYGPWMQEPDRLEFKSHGLDCLMVRNQFYSWCGYVGVPKSHPLFGCEIESYDIRVHGGITFTGPCHGPICHFGEKVWWLGFDTGHSGDLMPTIQVMIKRFEMPIPSFIYKECLQDVYRDVKYVKRQCHTLARQLFYMAKRKDQSSLLKLKEKSIQRAAMVEQFKGYFRNY